MAKLGPTRGHRSTAIQKGPPIWLGLPRLAQVPPQFPAPGPGSTLWKGGAIALFRALGS
ncbi:MAG: hypothetical protein ACI8X5_001824 [Planctomycetota bacterium]|jgi:hypothetical protein